MIFFDINVHIYFFNEVEHMHLKGKVDIRHLRCSKPQRYFHFLALIWLYSFFSGIDPTRPPLDSQVLDFLHWAIFSDELTSYEAAKSLQKQGIKGIPCRFYQALSYFRSMNVVQYSQRKFPWFWQHARGLLENTGSLPPFLFLSFRKTTLLKTRGKTSSGKSVQIGTRRAVWVFTDHWSTSQNPGLNENINRDYSSGLYRTKTVSQPNEYIMFYVLIYSSIDAFISIAIVTVRHKSSPLHTIENYSPRNCAHTIVGLTQEAGRKTELDPPRDPFKIILQCLNFINFAFCAW